MLCILLYMLVDGWCGLLSGVASSLVYVVLCGLLGFCSAMLLSGLVWCCGAGVLSRLVGC